MIECGYYNMDCLDGMELIEDKTIDMILCDLPYGTTRNAGRLYINTTSYTDRYRRGTA